MGYRHDHQRCKRDPKLWLPGNWNMESSKVRIVWSSGGPTWRTFCGCTAAAVTVGVRRTLHQNLTPTPTTPRITHVLWITVNGWWLIQSTIVGLILAGNSCLIILVKTTWLKEIQMFIHLPFTLVTANNPSFFQNVIILMFCNNQFLCWIGVATMICRYCLQKISLISVPLTAAMIMLTTWIC